jgi:hypothetical protein
MTEHTSSPGGSDFDSELHRRNVERLGTDNVIIAGYPGSGAALIGNILLELGLPYFDPYTEVLDGTRHTTAAAPRRDYRARLAASHHLDLAGGRRLTSACGPVFVKTHLYPKAFVEAEIRAVTLLVRDPRDAMYSYYRWRQGFSESGESGTFADFLRRPGPNATVPATDWAEFYNQWRTWATAVTSPLQVLRFEDLKADPTTTVGHYLAGVGASVTTPLVAAAIETSSFTAMRAHEDRVADGGTHRIMRRGQVGEWREWYSPAYAKAIAVPELRSVAAKFGYQL